MALTEGLIKMFGRWTGTADEKGLNDGFNQMCAGLQGSAESASGSQSGRPQAYLRAIGLGASVLLILYFWLIA